MAWPEVVTAISAVVIALVLLFCGPAYIIYLFTLRRVAMQLAKVTESLERDGKPLIQSARNIVDDAGRAVSNVRGEVDAIVQTSSDVRERIENTVDSVEARLMDLEALLDVVQEEVEETALDLAAALRTTRRGGSLLRKVKRAVVGRGR